MIHKFSSDYVHEDTLMNDRSGYKAMDVNAVYANELSTCDLVLVLSDESETWK